jgi:hypothetical protein
MLFFLVYGAEAVLPTYVIHDAPRVVLYTEEEGKEARENDIDLLEEAREITLSRTTVYQQNLRRYHAQKVNPRRFEEGDLVLRLKQGTEGRHKLTPPWEGPFILSRALHNDAYYLIDAQAPQEGQGGQVQKRNQVAMEHSSAPSLLLLKLNVCISILLYAPALHADARLMNEMLASRGDRALPPVYIVVYFQFSFICRLAWFEYFLYWPSNVSAPKAAL